MRVLLTSVPRTSLHTLRELFPNLTPYSLQVLAGAVRGEHTTRILDLQNNLRPMLAVHEAIEQFRPEVIGISILSMVDIDSVGRMVRELRQRYGSSMRYIVGGQPVTFRPDIFIDAGFDVCVMRHGEETFLELLDRWDAGDEDLSGVRGIAYDDDGELVQTPERLRLKSLDESPIPVWDVLDPGLISAGYSASMELARGCPWACEFCTIPDFNEGRVLRKSIDRLRAELDILESRNVTEVYFVDDCFGSSPKQLREWVEEMEVRGGKIRWGIQIRADIIVKQQELIERAAAAGLFGCVVGFEGYGADVFDNVSKGGRSGPELNQKAAQILRDNGVCVFGTHLFGAKGDGFKTALRTWWYGRKNSDVFRFTMYTPLLGSKTFAQLDEEGGLREGSFEDFSYAKYMVDDDRDPMMMQLGFYALVLGHYMLPSTMAKMLFSKNDITRIWNRRAYTGAAKFVLGQAFGAVRKKSTLVDRVYRKWAGWNTDDKGGGLDDATKRKFAFSSHADVHAPGQTRAGVATVQSGGNLLRPRVERRKARLKVVNE